MLLVMDVCGWPVWDIWGMFGCCIMLYYILLRLKMLFEWAFKVIIVKVLFDPFLIQLKNNNESATLLA
jgi:hypothetical protein